MELEFLGEGTHGRVYTTSEDVVVKILKGDISCTTARNLLEEERRMQQSLYDLEITVPETYGVWDVKLNGIRTPGLFMERVLGRRLDALDGNERDHTLRMAERELKRAREYGFAPADVGDSSEDNIILGDNGLVYLIDLADWEVCNPQ